MRTDEAVLLVAVGAAQVFAIHSWLAGLLMTLAYAGQRLHQRVSASAARTERPPLLLVYRGQVLPDALALAALNEADLNTFITPPRPGGRTDQPTHRRP